MALVNRFNAVGVLQGHQVETARFDISRPAPTPGFVQLGRSRGDQDQGIWHRVYVAAEDAV